MARKAGYSPGRRTDRRDSQPRFVILCEGARTEPLYFRAFKVSSLATIQADGKGMNTWSLVQRLAGMKKADPDRRQDDQYWAVFDMDNFGWEDVNHAYALAAQEGIRVAFSNEAFEIWYWFHYDQIQSAITRRAYQDKLSERLGWRYEKNDQRMYAALLDRQTEAIRRAEKARRIHEENGNSARENPSTTVDLLVTELRRYDRGILLSRAREIVQRLRRRGIPVSLEEESEILSYQRSDVLDDWEKKVVWIPSAAELLHGSPPPG